MGYEAPRPQGSYYVFPKTPIPDDVAFIRLLQEEGILAVPGIGFRARRLYAAFAHDSARRSGARLAGIPTGHGRLPVQRMSHSATAESTAGSCSSRS